ncbi:MAG: hypothetical protein LW847_09080 [Burkholderiales bacterium]|nr:hypothetical protein [Burkholderiales bacterium]
MSSDRRFWLDGANATIDRVEETGGVRGLFERNADLTVTAYLRNETGERFLVIWHAKSEGKPYVQHLGKVRSSQAEATDLM